MYLETFKTILNWKSATDICLVAILFYQIISMLKGTRAAQILIGLLVIFIAYVFSSILQLETLNWIISKFYSSFIIVVIVLFQDDIKRLLSKFGRGPFFTGLDIRSGSDIISEVINVAKSLSHERIGGLVVFERSIGLDKLYDHSIRLDALISEQLLSSIFQSFSPLHDGAVIVQKNRITCASAQLPLSKNPRFSKKLGTRHSAAVGISEETDAVVLVVSEETGSISIAWEGNLQKQASPEAAKKMLHVLLLPRGERNIIVKWIEDYLIFNFNKMRQKFQKNVLYSRTDKGHLYHDSEKLKSLNVLQSSFSKEAKLQEIKLNENLIMSGVSFPEVHDVEKEIDENLETSFEKNEALKSIAELAPEDRFDPPIPKAPPPRDVSIGGVSLNPPIDTLEKGEKEG